jgi:Domain of unknown function (DUF6249)
MNEEWIPIAMFAAIALIFFLMLYFKHRNRAEMQQTVRLALEKGTELTPELISRLGSPAEPSKNKDLRLSLIWFALAVGLALIGVAMSYFAVEVLYGCLAGAALPLSIGVAYLIMWRYGSKETAG